MLSFERFLDIPIVPYVRAGLSGDLVYYPGAGAIGGGPGAKIGGGVHYFLTRAVGLGAETAFTVGGASVSNGFGVAWGFFGLWDFTLGARFAF